MRPLPSQLRERLHRLTACRTFSLRCRPSQDHLTNHVILTCSCPVRDLVFLRKNDFAVERVFTRPYPSHKSTAKVDGDELNYVKAPENQNPVTSGPQRFAASASDYDVRVEDRKAGARVHVHGDRPLQDAGLWSIQRHKRY